MKCDGCEKDSYKLTAKGAGPAICPDCVLRADPLFVDVFPESDGSRRFTEDMEALYRMMAAPFPPTGIPREVLDG